MLSNILQWHMTAPTTENHLAAFGNCVEVDRPWSRLPQGPMLTSSFHSIPVGLGVWQLILFWGSLSKECSQFDIHIQAQKILEPGQGPFYWSIHSFLHKTDDERILPQSWGQHLLNKEGWFSGFQFLQPPFTPPWALSFLRCLTVSS